MTRSPHIGEHTYDPTTSRKGKVVDRVESAWPHYVLADDSGSWSAGYHEMQNLLPSSNGKTVVAVVGPSRIGKTRLANELVRQWEEARGEGAVRVSLAAPVRTIARNLPLSIAFGHPYGEAEEYAAREIEDALLEVDSDEERGRMIDDWVKEYLPDSHVILSFLTKAIKRADPFFFANLGIHAIDKALSDGHNTLVVIDDLRYAEEFALLNSMLSNFAVFEVQDKISNQPGPTFAQEWVRDTGGAIFEVTREEELADHFIRLRAARILQLAKRDDGARFSLALSDGTYFPNVRLKGSVTDNEANTTTFTFVIDPVELDEGVMLELFFETPTEGDKSVKPTAQELLNQIEGELEATREMFGYLPSRAIINVILNTLAGTPHLERVKERVKEAEDRFGVAANAHLWRKVAREVLCND